jgi:hypothetical protein
LNIVFSSYLFCFLRLIANASCSSDDHHHGYRRLDCRLDCHHDYDHHRRGYCLLGYCYSVRCYDHYYFARFSTGLNGYWMDDVPTSSLNGYGWIGLDCCYFLSKTCPCNHQSRSIFHCGCHGYCLFGFRSDYRPCCLYGCQLDCQTRSSYARESYSVLQRRESARHD